MKSQNKIFKNTNFLLSAIAGFSIIRYYLNLGNTSEIWWSNCFFILAGGLASLAIYNLAINHRIFNTIVSTGLTIFILNAILPLFEEFNLINFLPSYEFYKFIVVAIVFLVIAFPTEGIVNKYFQKGDLILVPLVSVLIAFALIWIKENIFIPALICFGYNIVLFINISLKRRKNEQSDNADNEIDDYEDEDYEEEDS